jgi:uncharacterized protein YjbI with pentapeptide repeats
MKKWLEEKRTLLIFIGIMTLLVVFIGSFVGGYWFRWGWTGFPAKTEWDWLNLLGVLAIPVVVGLGAAWYTVQQGRVSDRENTDNQRETALQAYIDKMSELLLVNNLRQSAEDDEVRNIARVRTLTVLRGLDPKRKVSVLQFLYESRLMHKDKFIIDLRGANLSRADLFRANLNRAELLKVDLHEANLGEAYLDHINLSGADLTKANLSRADLSGACMSGAWLSGANLNSACLSGADLSGVDLKSADLSGADLNRAILRGAKGTTDDQLGKAKSLEGATMPDGSKHP